MPTGVYNRTASSERRRIAAIRKALEDPEVVERRRQASLPGIQRAALSGVYSRELFRRHRENPKFHKAAVSALKKGAGGKGYPRDEVWRAKLRVAQRRNWEDEKYASRMSKVLAGGRITQLLGPSKPALSFYSSLSNFGLFGFSLEYPIGRYHIDIANVDSKIAIEIDGDYFHRRKSQIKRDFNKDRFLKSKGWRILRIKVSRLKYIRYWIQLVKELCGDTPHH